MKQELDDMFELMPPQLQEMIKQQIAANVKKVRRLVFFVILGCIALFGIGMLMGALLF